MTGARRICVVTGTRAEYGLLRHLMGRIASHPEVELQVVATGSHLVASLGGTIDEVLADGFTLDAAVDMLLASDTPQATAKSMGVATMGFADTFARITPDVVVVLGDRYEILAAAQTAMLCGIPVAHIHGGEVTEGAFDDAIRHAVTKLSHLHLVATDAFARRVLQLGEVPERVHVVGALGLEDLAEHQPMTLAQLSGDVGLDLAPGFLLVTFHPATLGDLDPIEGQDRVLGALDRFPDLRILITYPNADPGGRSLIEPLRRWADDRSDRVALVPSLGRHRYLSAMMLARAVVGNSSSGIVETPSAGTPTVDIGDRQRGRPRAPSVLHCGEDAEEIARTIERALTPEMAEVAGRRQNPYGSGQASERILDVLLACDPPRLLRKRFCDLTVGDVPDAP
jgi:UDP-hydrolysing UDP-N-acetyl-D-glucosamine 2-epimerase